MGNPLKNEIWFQQVIFGGNEQGRNNSTVGQRGGIGSTISQRFCSFRAALAALAVTQMKQRCTLGGANKHFLLASFVHRL